METGEPGAQLSGGTARPTFLLVRLLLDVADLVAGAEGLEVMSSVDKVQACDKLLGELRQGQRVLGACLARGLGLSRDGRTWSTASCSCVSRSPMAAPRLCGRILGRMRDRRWIREARRPVRPPVGHFGLGW